LQVNGDVNVDHNLGVTGDIVGGGQIFAGDGGFALLAGVGLTTNVPFIGLNSATNTLLFSGGILVAVSNGIVSCISPSISSQPVDVTCITNTTTNFSVTVSGTAPLAYQWRDSGAGTNLANSPFFAGVTTSTLYVSNVTTAFPTNYIVVATNACGSITSSVATLTVTNGSSSSGWVDFVPLASCDNHGAGGNSFQIQLQATLTAGTIVSNRMGIGVADVPDVVKMAWYNPDGTIVGSTAYYPEVAISSPNAYVYQTLSTPITVTNGVYWFVFQFGAVGDADVSFRTSPADLPYNLANYTTYSAFPSATWSAPPTSSGSIGGFAIGWFYAP
jgi:hypothetical protein